MLNSVGFSFLYVICLLLALTLPCSVSLSSPSLKVLVIVPAAYGHLYGPFKLVRELTQRGHQATLLLLDCPDFNNLTFIPSGINVKNLSIPCEALRGFAEKSTFMQGMALSSTFNSLELLKLLKEEFSTHQPDVVVLDFFLFTTEALSRTLNISTVILHYVVQEFFIESYIPSMAGPPSTLPLSFSGRMLNFLASMMYRAAVPIVQYLTYPDVTEVGAEWPSTPSMTIVSGEFGMFPARSVPPYVKVVGPMISEERQPHDKELDVLLEEMGNTSTLVYVSLGTVFTLPSDVLKNLLEGLGNVSDVKFLWAVTNKDMAASLSSLVVPPNVLIKHHLPQLQVLMHPSVKLFISHCGANSASEAQHAGIPVLAIPLGADQFFIASTLVSLGMAEKLDSTNIQVESFTSTVNKLLNDTTYRTKALHFSKLINTAGGAQEAASHIERLAAIGTMDPFIPEGLKVSWWIRWHLDLYITVLVVILVLRKSFPYLCCCFKFCRNRNEKVKLE